MRAIIPEKNKEISASLESPVGGNDLALICQIGVMKDTISSKATSVASSSSSFFEKFRFYQWLKGFNTDKGDDGSS
jgi:hypothetical protein